MFAALTLGTPAAANADQLCNELEKFETAHLPPAPEQTRWIELHWEGSWSRGIKVSCISSGDAEAQALCRYSATHVSLEFPNAFPVRILECKGYRMPPYLSIGNWQAEIELGSGEDRLHKLLIDLDGQRDGTGAIRYISVGADVAGANEIEYLPIAPLSDDEEVN